MKTTILAALTATALVLGASAQEAAIESRAAQTTVVGEHYEILSSLGEVSSRALAREMDLRFAAYELLFRFDPSTLPGKLKIRAFSDKAAFDAYLQTEIGETREEAAYLHYSDRDRSVLAVFLDGPTGRILAHQAFIQYLRAFIPNPPSWMREGFAVYFEGIGYDATKDTLTYEENLDWLETVKGWGAKPPSLASVLLADIEGGATLEQTKLTGASWALVSFLLNADGEAYRRTLYEAFMVLGSDKSAADNALAVVRRAAMWIDPENAQKDCTAYLSTRKTFSELIEEGRTAYAAKEAAKAESIFLSAAETRPTHYAPHYYLGLLAYERKDYALAENHYRTAEQFGADVALVNYALGVNAAADGRKSDALAFLKKAKAAAPARYAEKVDEIISRLK
jgi:tetratricopeptide (TPR) repeat protein